MSKSQFFVPWTDGTFKIIVYKQKQIIQTFFIYFIQNAVLRRKKAPLDRVGRKVKKIFFFFRVGPKNRVGRDMGNR